MIDAIRACMFDVFGTVVDWHGSVSRDLAGFADERGIEGVDWTRFAEDWRRLYNPAMEEVRSGRRAWTILDVLHRESLVHLLGEYRIDGCTDADIDHMNRAWHRLDPWPDAVPGLTRLKAKYVIAPCSNGNIALIVDMAKRGGLPWDVVLGAEPARRGQASARGLPLVVPDARLRSWGSAHGRRTQRRPRCRAGVRAADRVRPAPDRTR